MSDPVARYGLPHVTVPRDMVQHSRPSAVDQLVATIRRRHAAWLAMPPAERARIVEERLAKRELKRDERLRARIADERDRGLQYVDTLLDTMARSAGLDPYLAWRRPRANERAERLADMTLTIRRDLAAAGHKPATTGLEARLPRVVVDDTVPAGTLELRTEEGTVVGRIVGLS